MNDLHTTATAIASHYAPLPSVEAVVVAGSLTSAMADPASDIDMYVYSRSPLALDARQAIAAARADHPEVGNTWWEAGDEWIERETGTRIDIMFRDVAWLEGDLKRTLVDHVPSVGYSTCIWYNVLHSQILIDSHGWFAALQRWADQPYPEALRQSIIAHNLPLLRTTQSSLLYQIRRAVERGDLVSVNHRVAALVASYFDVLFAINRLPHPGEKRLVQFAQRDGSHLPEDMAADIAAVLRAGAAAEHAIIGHLQRMLDRLDRMLQADSGA